MPSFRPRLASSLEYVAVNVTAKEAGAFINPTADTVTMAFTENFADPVAANFKTASWETDASTNPDTYTALCLVGPGGAVTLTPGDYTVWVKVVDTPESPIILVPGMLTVL
jgi:hypothetical protein